MFSNQSFFHNPVSLSSATSLPNPTCFITLSLSLLFQHLSAVNCNAQEILLRDVLGFFLSVQKFKEKIYGAYLSLVETSPSS